MKARLWDITQLLAPRACLRCGSHGPPMCRGCLSELELLDAGCRRCGNPEAGAEARSCSWCDRIKVLPERLCAPLAYRHAGRDLYHIVKRQGYWRLMASLVDRGVARLLATTPFLDYECLTPIPETFRGKLRRAFNPAERIAMLLSERTGLSMRRLLRAKPFRRPQVGLAYEARRKNARGRFAPRGGPAPRSVLLVDDVLTTGATMEAATDVLRRAGSARVAWFCLFRAL